MPLNETDNRQTSRTNEQSYEIVGVFMARSALCIEMNEFRLAEWRATCAFFLWFFDIWKLSQEPDRDSDREHLIVGALSAHNAFLLELLTLMGIFGSTSVAVRLNNCLYFAFKCEYK